MTLKNDAIASWNLTNVCNFDCYYCCQRNYFSRKKGKFKSPIPVKDVIKCLKTTDNKWTVNMVGGEVLVLPKFIEICCELVDNNIRIGFETNLSVTKKVIEFANVIDPNEVDWIAVSLHVEEREKRGAVEELIQNIFLLKNKGFNIVMVNYVLHPSLFHRFEEDYEFFKTKGINLTPIPFKGFFNNNYYPDSYSTQEKDLILSLYPDAGFIKFPSRGHLCNAGKSFVHINENGTIFRCVGDRRKLGNVQQPLRLYKKPEPCHAGRCPCWGKILVVDPDKIKCVFRNPPPLRIIASNKLKSMVRKNKLLRPLSDIAAFIRYGTTPVDTK
jgi:MoaA/NifB/PqqE/SkfB family radical SAM enzyme